MTDFVISSIGLAIALGSIAFVIWRRTKLIRRELKYLDDLERDLWRKR